mmetsp:Transcript_31786/g.59762  ORF Transcript_31786/g.59762 Transcript_31786/m.59762 type:complete len:246 (+) Transcript_31786:43-780(+)
MIGISRVECQSSTAGSGTASCDGAEDEEWRWSLRMRLDSSNALQSSQKSLDSDPTMPQSWDRMEDSLQQSVAKSEQWTTVMLRNLPPSFSRGRLIYLLAKQGFAGTYNFLYVPLCFKEKVSLCYAFINFINKAALSRFWKHFSGFQDWGIPSGQIGEVCWCARHQGLEEAVEYYRNTSVMHSSVPDECKPIIIHRGIRVPFPLPTKNVKVPKKVKRSNVDDSLVRSSDPQLQPLCRPAEVFIFCL